MTEYSNLTLKDQLGRDVVLQLPLQRIVSVVPSQTELLFDFGAGDLVSGVTWFCIHPTEAKKKTKIGGTKNLKLEKIAALNPDLILANKEENDQDQINWLAERFPLWISDIKTLDDACKMISSVGAMVQKAEKALDINSSIAKSFSLLASKKSYNTLYLIWKEPWMAAGSDTFINCLMEKCGFLNICPPSRYPELSDEEIISLNPDLILLSSEPFPFKDKHINELQLLVPGAKILLVDGEMFSWYGSRLIQAVTYLRELVAGIG